MFTLIKTEGRARRGSFQTVHGLIQTPVFMNVATAAAIKGGISAFDLTELCKRKYLKSAAVRKNRSAPARKFMKTAEFFYKRV